MTLALVPVKQSPPPTDPTKYSCGHDALYMRAPARKDLTRRDSRFGEIAPRQKRRHGARQPPTALRAARWFRISRKRARREGRNESIWCACQKMDVCYSRDGWQLNLIISLQGTLRECWSMSVSDNQAASPRYRDATSYALGRL